MVVSCGACGNVGEGEHFPRFPSFRGTWGKRSRSAQRIVHISTGRAPAQKSDAHAGTGLGLTLSSGCDKTYPIWG